MKIILLGLIIPFILSAQPDQWPVAIDPAEVPTLLGPARRTMDAFRINAADTPIVDGKKDEIWNNISPVKYDRYVNHHTIKKDGQYVRISDLSDGTNQYRMPLSDDDFSGNFRIIYDQDKIYFFWDITDNEVNDNLINVGLKESFEIQVSPYSDSAQQVLLNNSYPPYKGVAPEINKKFCYWAYLGAFKFWFFLEPNGKCSSEIREKADAKEKINYSQRLESCQCAWQPKSDGTGYTAEVSLSLNIALADSALNPFKVPATENENRTISLEMKCYDEDLGMKPIQASWNSENDNVWDAMIYAGKLTMKGLTVSNEIPTENRIQIYPNPSNDILFFNKKIEVIDVISTTGVLLQSAKNAEQVNTSNLLPGLYILRTSEGSLVFIKK